MQLEDIDYIFEKGGITGGVLSKGGRFADRRHDIEDAHHHDALAEPKTTESPPSETIEFRGKA